MGKDETMSTCSEPVGEAEERIYVAVRMRPLNQRESSRNEVSDWSCIDNTTVLFKGSFPDRSLFPTAYTFDRVFGTDSQTEEVYNEAAKEIALSVVSGINSSIFAYGQTSSGKTYTMSGITQCAMEDVFRYIDQHQEREFVLKFSAMEIYNEHVRDLLSSDTTPLRLLDDPEKGTVVERLTEEILEDWNHLQELLSICEAQRQTGETNLNEASSRSHQIMRLTVESSVREFVGGNSNILTAQVNFVDLAGSERASQTLAAGVRLKEGSHINRSLLTLGTVIRKLSKGRNGHVPYRDSKLTRILQNSLGGNARTAIICTMSPARCHVEQSRNTLLFASCAKEVSTNAKVNLVMSDKALVKQLQKELARLESQLCSIGSTTANGDTAAALRMKDQLIQEMDKEIQELTRQRDLAQSRLESMLKPVEEDQTSKLDRYLASESSQVTNNLPMRNKSSDFDEFNQSSPGKQIMQIAEGSEEDFLLDDSTPKFTGLDPCDGWEDIAQTKGSPSEASCKEVQCIESQTSYLQIDMEKEVPSLALSNENSLTPTSELHENSVESKEDETINALKQKIQELHETINRLEQHPALASDVSSTKGFKWCRSRSRNSVVMTIPSNLWSKEYPSKIWKHEEGLDDKQEPFDQSPSDSIYGARIGSMRRIESQSSIQSADSEESMITREIDIDIDDTSSILDFVAGVNKISKLQSESETAKSVVPEAYSKHTPSKSASEVVTDGGATQWPMQFEMYQRKIIDLWATCNVPLVHRSIFFLLFKGESSDNVYMEVELRRLKFLRASFSHGMNTNKGIAGQIISSVSSAKVLNREREMLARQIQKKLTRKERENNYKRWGIKLDSKRRSLQLASRLWTDKGNMKHVRESAALVAKLVGFVESQHFPKEMFGLSLSTPSLTRKSSRWRDNVASLL